MSEQRRRIAWLITALLLCLLLCACGKKQTAPEPTPAPVQTAAPAPETPAPTPKPTPTPTPELRIMGAVYTPADTAVELAGLQDADAAATAEFLRQMPRLQSIRIGSQEETPLSWESLKLLHDAAPQAVIDYAFTMFDRPFNLSDEVMDLKYIPMEDNGALVAKVTACMSRLRTLDMDTGRGAGAQQCGESQILHQAQVSRPRPQQFP